MSFIFALQRLVLHFTIALHTIKIDITHKLSQLVVHYAHTKTIYEVIPLPKSCEKQNVYSEKRSGRDKSTTQYAHPSHNWLGVRAPGEGVRGVELEALAIIPSVVRPDGPRRFRPSRLRRSQRSGYPNLWRLASAVPVDESLQTRFEPWSSPSSLEKLHARLAQSEVFCWEQVQGMRALKVLPRFS